MYFIKHISDLHGAKNHKHTWDDIIPPRFKKDQIVYFKKMKCLITSDPIKAPCYISSNIQIETYRYWVLMKTSIRTQRVNCFWDHELSKKKNRRS